MDFEGMDQREWRQVMDAMEEVGPYYERVNHLITFGLVDRWRRSVAAFAKPDDVVLELGSGPGNFTKHLGSKQVFCVEPSGELAASSREFVDESRVNLMRGVGESIPLADSSVDKVFCVFSFRDFYNRAESTDEMHRVLREGGEVFIVDIAKPPPGPLAKLLQLHVRHIVPPLARLAAPPSAKERWSRDPYRTFVETYDGFGTTKVCEDLLVRSGFSEVRTEYLELKGAAMTRGKKPWKSTS